MNKIFSVKSVIFKYWCLIASFTIVFFKYISSYFYLNSLIYFLIQVILLVFSYGIYRRVKSNGENVNPTFGILSLIIVTFMHAPIYGLHFSNPSCLYLLGSVVFSPVIEEFGFRIIPLKGFRGKKTTLLTILLISSALFTIYHFPIGFQSIFNFKGLQHFVFGICMGIIFLSFRSAALNIMIHAFANTIGLFLN